MNPKTPAHASITESMVDAISLDLDLLKKKKRVIHPDPTTADHDYAKTAQAKTGHMMAMGK